MKKNTIKAFTLVEMLIVIVIIGILIASLMPRMQTAQGRARDVARKNDLSQIETAIITSQADRGEWPGMGNNRTHKASNAGSTEFLTANDAGDGARVEQIKNQLTMAGMSEVPSDPNGSNDNYGIGGLTTKDVAVNAGQYLYYVGKRNGVSDAGFVLMAKTEVEGSSNWVVCDGDTKTLAKGYITDTYDLSQIVLCSSITQDSTAANCGVKASPATDVGANNANPLTGYCTYTNTAELRYILVY